MTDKSDREKAASGAEKDTGSEREPVAKTKLDISFDDLMYGLTENLHVNEDGTSDAKSIKPVAKTLVESDAPTFDQIKQAEHELTESGRRVLPTRIDMTQSGRHNASEMQKPTVLPIEQKQTVRPVEQKPKDLPVEPKPKVLPVEQKSMVAPAEQKNSIKELAKTLPESEAKKAKTRFNAERKALKSLAQTLPDPQSQKRKITRVMTSEKLAKSNEPRKREQYVVAKTQLDHQVFFQALSESHLKEEARVHALLEERAKEPPKPPPELVKADKPASPCPFRWEESDAAERFRYCQKCQTPIYNFSGMERAEAEALVFNRENREKFTVYGREDGKFMTVDCPLQVKRKKGLVVSLLVAVAFIIGAVALLMIMPPPAPQSQSQTEDASIPSEPGSITFSSTDPVRTPTSGTKSSNIQTTDGGTRYQTFALPESDPQSSEAPDPDEDGRFWKFE